jgi:hypothetical protein
MRVAVIPKLDRIRQIELMPGSHITTVNKTLFTKEKPRRRGATPGLRVPLGEPVMGRETHHSIISIPALFLGQ